MEGEGVEGEGGGSIARLFFLERGDSFEKEEDGESLSSGLAFGLRSFFRGSGDSLEGGGVEGEEGLFFLGRGDSFEKEGDGESLSSGLSAFPFDSGGKFSIEGG